MSTLESLFVNSYFDYLLHKFVGLEKLLDIAVKKVPERILEVGCGSGITTSILAQRFPHSEITAIDLDESQITRARKRLVNEKVHFLQGDATRLQFEPHSFDACVASYALHHMPAFPRALREIHRILYPGAHLYVLEVPFSREVLRVLKENKPHEEVEEPADIRSGFFTKKRLLHELQRAGFRVVQSKGVLRVYLECERV